MKLKTKLVLGLAFLFVVILTFGSLSFYYINRLNNDSKLVLKNNHESLVYCNDMLKALENIQLDKRAINAFESNLKKQENNITEFGEKELTQNVRKDFGELLADPRDSANYPQIRQSIHVLSDLNQAAILRKNAVVEKTTESANLWLSVIFVVLGIIAFTFVINFPAVIAEPIRALNEGISAIASKNYRKRIHLDQKDEFGELANAFNVMAEKLDEYENSNLAQLRFEKSRIETIINQMKDGIMGLDTKKNILFLNAVAEKLLGLKEADIIGKYSPDIAIKNDLMRTLLQEANGTELKIYADNKESFFNKDIFAVNNNGAEIGQVIVLRNITPFHELNEAKTNFIATVSHELKTPISSIKMSAHLLQDQRIGNLSAEQTELVKSIGDDAERLLKITGELLNMAQVETGNIQLSLQAADPSLIVGQSMDAVSFRATQRNIVLKTDIAPVLPFVQADIEKTSWVLINFLTNAIRYAPENSVITVGVQQNKKMVEFTVRDSGNGIDEKHLPRIFDRYYKVPGTDEHSSTGLGLSISREFIEAQHGNIWVQSKIGEGSVFGFCLPVK